MIKLVASDLDGTLLNKKGELSEITKQTVIECLQQGIQVIPCSARIYSEIPAWLKQEKRIKYIVCENGANIVDNQTEQSVRLLTINQAAFQAVMKHSAPISRCWSMSINNHVYCSNQILREKEQGILSGFDNQKFAKTRTFVEDYRPHLNAQQNNVSKIHFALHDAAHRDTLKEALIDIPEVSITSSYFRNIEVTHPEATKGNGLRYLMDLLNYKQEEVIAFGDNDNDITMIEVAGIGVAVENATERLKKVANQVTMHHDDDAVAKTLQAIVLKK